MSPTIPILSALLLTLILGSTEGEPRMNPLSLLRQTLQYWREVYKAYSDEVALGYCWADNLLRISSELSTNLPAPPPATSPEDHFDAIECTETTTTSQRNPFPQNALADAAAPCEGTREGKRQREKRWSHTTAGSGISKFVHNPDEHPVALRSNVIQRRGKWMMNKTEQTSLTASYNYTGRNSEIDENERITRMMDSPLNRRRRALSIVSELLRDERKAPRGGGHEFSSRGTSSQAVNPTPNPRDGDKVDFESTSQREDSRRKVLRSPTSHRGSLVEDDPFASRSFSLKVARDGSPGGQRRFPFRRYWSSQERNSRADEMSFDSRTQRRDHEIEGDPAGRHAPLNNDGSSSTPFRRASAERPRRVCVVKLMDSEGNSSYGPTINSKTPRRKPEELSSDSLLSPRGGSVITERSPLEFRDSEAATLSRFKMIGGNDAKKRHGQQPWEEENSKDGRDVSAAMIHPFLLSELKAPYQQMLHKNRGFSPVPAILQKSRRDDHIRIIRSSAPLSSNEQSIRDYRNQMTEHLKHDYQISTGPYVNITSSEIIYTQEQFSSTSSFAVEIFRKLKMFVQVGRRIMDVVQMNGALSCTRDYLWAKFIKWIDTENPKNFNEIFKIWFW